MARVLCRPGFVGLMLHRRDGPILAHNLVRREAILWAIDEERLPAIARDCDPAEGLPDTITTAPTRGATLFGERSAAWEIAEAIRRTLTMGAGDDTRGRAATLDEITERARSELARIGSLEAACDRAADRERLEREWRGAGFAVLGHNPVTGPDGLDFAEFHWLVRE